MAMKVRSSQQLREIAFIIWHSYVGPHIYAVQLRSYDNCDLIPGSMVGHGPSTINEDYKPNVTRLHTENIKEESPRTRNASMGVH